jgi:hypothetical protein
MGLVDASSSSNGFTAYIDKLKGIHKHETAGNHKKSNPFMISIGPCHPDLKEEVLETALQSSFEPNQFGLPASWWAVKEITPSRQHDDKEVDHHHLHIYAIWWLGVMEVQKWGI